MELKSNKIPIRNIEVSLDDVKRISRRLAEAVQQHALVIQNEQVRPPDQSEAEFQHKMEYMRQEAFKVLVTIKGKRGEILLGSAPEVFDSSNLPDEIIEIYLSNVAAFERTMNFRCPDRFELLLDFRKPDLIDSQNPVSAATPNLSNLTIESTRDPFVANIKERVTGVTDNRTRFRMGLHKPFVYDALLWFVGFPIILYTCYRFSSFLAANVGIHSKLLESIIYVWLVGVGLVTYRFLFGYTKWAFPTVELESNERETRQHRRFWFGIFGALTASLILDIWRWSF